MKKTLLLIMGILAFAASSALAATQFDFLLSQVRTSTTSLAGGKVYFYSTGTTTPQTVWLDPAETIPAANPYSLDANGTAQLYGNGVYRIVIKDSAGVTKYDRDSVYITSSLPVSAQAEDPRSYMDGKGGRPTLAAWMADNSIDAYGAIMAAAASGKPIVIAGSMRVSAPLTVSRIYGLGRGVSSLSPTDSFSGSSIINITNGAKGYVRDLEINGRQSAHALTASTGVYVNNSPNVTVENCYIHDLKTAGVWGLSGSTNLVVTRNAIADIYGAVGSTGVLVDGVLNAKVADNDIQRVNRKADQATNGTDDGNAVYFKNGSDGGIASGNSIYDCGRRAVKIQSSNITVANNPRMEDCADSAVQIQLAGGSGLSNIKVFGNAMIFTLQGAYGAVLEEFVRDVQIYGNSIIGPYVTGIEVRQGVVGASITGNTIKDTAGWGIRVSNLAATSNPTSNIKITGNTLVGCGQTNSHASIESEPGTAAVTNLSVIGNDITGNGTQKAIQVGSNQTGVTILGNVGSPITLYGGVVADPIALSGPFSATTGTFTGAVQALGLTLSGFTATQIFNAGSGVATTMFDFQVNGASKLSFDKLGGITATKIYAPALIQSGNDTAMAIGGRDFTAANSDFIFGGGTISATSGTFYGLNLSHTYNEGSGTASNIDLRVNRVQTAIGSGMQRLLSLQVTGVEKFGVDNAGIVNAAGGSANHAICWKADGKTLGYCSAAVAADGTCGTCN